MFDYYFIFALFSKISVFHDLMFSGEKKVKIPTAPTVQMLRIFLITWKCVYSLKFDFVIVLIYGSCTVSLYPFHLIHPYRWLSVFRSFLCRMVNFLAWYRWSNVTWPALTSTLIRAAPSPNIWNLSPREHQVSKNFL